MYNPFIENKHVRQLQECPSTPQCIICYETSADLMQCKGPCRSPICLPCVSLIRNQHNKCPARCTQEGFQVEPYPDYSCEFLCPYDPLHCTLPLPTRSHFEQHLQTCPFMTEQHKQQLNYRQNFRCGEGHLLIYLNERNYRSIFSSGTFFQTTRSINCCVCKEKHVCNAVCVDCCVEREVGPEEVMFCVRCRPLPCSRKQCPIGHELVVNNFSNESLTCDFCGMIVMVFDKVSFGDRTCNFDICLPCRNKLPEDNHLLPLGNVVRADYKKQLIHQEYVDFWGLLDQEQNNINQLQLMAHLQAIGALNDNELVDEDQPDEGYLLNQGEQEEEFVDSDEEMPNLHGGDAGMADEDDSMGHGEEEDENSMSEGEDDQSDNCSDDS